MSKQKPPFRAFRDYDAVKFAYENLSQEDFKKIYRSYRLTFWLQLSLFAVFLAAVVLELIFIPSETVPNGYADKKTTIILFETAFFIFPALPVWLIITSLTCAKEWRKYLKWYKSLPEE